MVGLDTNVLIRYLTRDDPDQYRVAKLFLESTCTTEEPGYITVIVLCEIVWVLSGAYNVDKSEVVETIAKIPQTPQLHVQQKSQVREALRVFADHPADFADCLIGQLHKEQGCTRTVTFDQDASALSEWKKLD